MKGGSQRKNRLIFLYALQTDSVKEDSIYFDLEDE